MASFQLNKTGDLPDTALPSSYPQIVDMREDANWPTDWAIYTSTDHGAGGIYLYVADGDPSDPDNWLSYDAALAAGVFDGFTDPPATNPIFLDPGEGDGDSNSPWVVRVDGEYLMTYHNAGFPTGQKTLLASSPDGLSFTPVRVNGTAVVLDHLPAMDSNHTGYFQWGPNPFPGVPFRFVGYGLLTGGDPSIFAQWGSDDGRTWELVEPINPVRGRLGLPAEWELEFNQIDPGSIREVGGEYIALIAAGTRASGLQTRLESTWEIYLDATGRRVTREAREVLPRGGAGAFDEREVGQLRVVWYNGGVAGVYHGGDADSVNCLAFVSGTFDPTAAPPDLRTPRTGYGTEIEVDFRGLAELPPELEFKGSAGSSYSLGPAGLTLTPGIQNNFAQIRLAGGLDPGDYEMIEVWAEGVSLPDKDIVIVGTGTDSLGDPGTGVYAVSYFTVSYKFQCVTRVASANLALIDSRHYETRGRQSVGARWWPQQAVGELLGHSGESTTAWDVDDSLVPAGLTVYPKLEVRTKPMTIERIRFRLRAPDTTAPAIDAGEVLANGSAVVLDFTEEGAAPLLPYGGASGFTVKADGEAIPVRHAHRTGDRQYTLHLGGVIRSGQAVTASYDAEAGNVIDGSDAGNGLAAFTDTALANNSAQADPGRAPGRPGLGRVRRSYHRKRRAL